MNSVLTQLVERLNSRRQEAQGLQGEKALEEMRWLNGIDWNRLFYEPIRHFQKEFRLPLVKSVFGSVSAERLVTPVGAEKLD